MRNLETNMHNVDFVWTSDKEYSSLLPIYEYMKKNVPSINTNFVKIKKFLIQGIQQLQKQSKKFQTQ